jgi:hypothetical protein
MTERQNMFQNNFNIHVLAHFHICLMTSDGLRLLRNGFNLGAVRTKSYLTSLTARAQQNL